MVNIIINHVKQIIMFIKIKFMCGSRYSQALKQGNKISGLLFQKKHRLKVLVLFEDEVTCIFHQTYDKNIYTNKVSTNYNNIILRWILT